MKILSLRRLLVVFVVIAGVLFAQLALAAYACPGQTSAMVVQAMPDCVGMDTAQPALCHASQHDGHQAPDKPVAPPVALFIPTALVQLLAPATLPTPRSLLPGFVLARTTAPPSNLLHCRFQL
ncbi:hypothetical protein QN362_15295 [Actimicrobium sp. CCC2.4]|uniref:hypothetical protein n=1 Tax=Actimicrobium sp. CCC2.4 TaxID=3048606 RepID=UPI002AC8FAB8|nr:hypothetical protein [Actimicrobium sp. CCC2.4]MEB0136701.1 hypothetical protein [Actimicrobium sp. CCC2.4]WPX33166.1 hypothetical protein RHM62_04800 [Actimicrobium sp. CCC2.4]